MRIAVVGGKLQGLEILYLASAAGFKTLLIDKDLELPAGKLCDSFLNFHFATAGNYPLDIGKIDLIFPALEDLASLELISDWGQKMDVPVVFDLDAYRISSSKSLSNSLIKRLKLPHPGNWPDCSLPVIAKPDNSSGSEGVKLICEREEVQELFDDFPCGLVIQEYVEGPSYSIEVIGRPGNYIALTITELFMDKDYDCCGVLAPAQLDDKLAEQLREQVLTLADEIQLYGIMDLEVILHGGELKILEIDARFPSQTPIGVFHATGVNMVEMLAELFVTGRVEEPEVFRKFAKLEHVRVTDSSVNKLGEHIIAESRHLQVTTDFFGAKVAITDSTGRNIRENWTATLIYEGSSYEELRMLSGDRLTGSA